MVGSVETSEQAPPPGEKVHKFRRPSPPVFSNTADERRHRIGRLALAARVLDAEGWGQNGVQLSVRDPGDDQSMWMIPAGRPLALMTSADCILMRIADLKVLDGGQSGKGFDLEAAALHSAVYLSRPDRHACVHAHTPYGKAFSLSGKPLAMMVQDSCTFYNSLPILPFGIGRAARSNQSQIAEAISGKKGFILQNRGLFLTSETVEGCVSYLIRLENLCRAQLLCEAAIKGRGGAIIPVGEQEVKFTFQNTGGEQHAWLMAMPYFAKQDRQTGGALVI